MLVAAEAVGVDVFGGQAGFDEGGVFGDGDFLDRHGDGCPYPAGDAEEVEDVHHEAEEDDAPDALGKVGDRAHEDGDDREYVDFHDVGKYEADEQAEHDREDVVEPVFDEVGDHRIFAKEGKVGHLFEDGGDDYADHHGGEQAGGAELCEGEGGAFFDGRGVHAEHVGADGGEAGDAAAVAAVLLDHGVMGDQEYHE